jgi:beta,beta-carotene 9',10'-dioxygenase
MHGLEDCRAGDRPMTAPNTCGLPDARHDAAVPAYLSGFQTLDAEISVPALPVQGSIPEWLTGTLLRMGPGRYGWGPDSYRHWFDGSGMIHKFSFAAGEVAYANRYVRGTAYAENERVGRIIAQTFATDPCQELFRKGFVHYHPTGNANVNAITAGDMLMALGEAPLPIAIDPQTLETRGEWPWRDEILLDADGKPRPQHTTAHPHFDRATGDLINHVEIFARECRYEIHRGPRDGKRTRFAVVPVERPAYMHSFGMTEQYVVLAEYPLVADVEAIAERKRPFIENYAWLPERGTIFTVVSKADGKVVARAQAEPFLGIHQINCFERDASIVFDVPAYPEGRHITNLYLDRRAAAEALEKSQVRRYTVPLNGKDATGEILFDEFAELPAIDYVRDAGLDYTTAYAAGGRRDRPEGFYNQLLRFDLRHNETRRWFEVGCYPGEPVFVPRPAGTNRNDGVVLSVVLDGLRERSFLLVLDAATFSEIGRAIAPHVIPFGFHGEFHR